MSQVNWVAHELAQTLYFLVGPQVFYVIVHIFKILF
jgi:hypothetical protein